MKNFVKKLISLLCSLCLSFAVFVPFILVNAENEISYVSLTANQVFIGAQSSSRQWAIITNKNTKFVLVGGVWSLHWMAIYTESFNYGTSNNYHSNDTLTANNTSNSYVLNGTTYYYTDVMMNTGDVTLNAPLHSIQNTAIETAIYYTFGAGAIDPVPPAPVYGNLADVSYSSNISGSGSESANNIDFIRWNNVVDNHNNLVPSDAVVDIRAIPGEYQASDKQSLLTKIYTDLILDYTSFATLAEVPFSNGQKSFVWSDVVSRFGNPFVFGNFTSMIQGGSYWYKQGWIYEVRLRIPSEEFIGEWIGIRNLTSSGVENSNNAIDNNGLDSTLIQTINNVNNINSNENNNFVTNNYYYNEYPIPENSSDLSDLTNPLQAILDAILSIPRKIGEKIQEVLGNIYEWLFVYEFNIEDYEEQKERMLQESGAFGEILSHLETMKDNIESHNGSSYVPLITWSDVYVMDEVMIPGGTFNLGNLVAEDPMRTFYLLYQTIVSGYLYFTLFRFLYKKIIKTLRT